MNSVHLIGRLTKDLELRTSTSGRKFVAFNLAVNEYYDNKQITQFVPCFAWEKQAENMARFLKKGSNVGIQGSLSVRQTNTDGKYETIVSVNARRVEFLENISNSNQSQSKTTLSNHGYDLVEEKNNDDKFGDDSILWED
ncbi:single-stranded DNA-binding protein [Spiroplasma endosymbiont of Crioceris asparagi]|uniref:single-stranded DNA-binding protein n=1 Tax=Spiroplasma endosymbiont of Crioceris asparagi TaxID=3066286 RepID=UPI0030CC96BD